MTLKQLRYFLAVLQAESFTAAARSLHVAQPAIGVQIGSLEDELGVKLLTRHSRGVVPTEAGGALAGEAARLVAEVERMRRDIMERGREPRGRIALGLTGTVVHALCARLVETCRGKYPDVHLTVREGMSHRLTGWLTQGQIDVAVTCAPPEESGAVSEALAMEPLYFVAPPGHVLAQGPDIALRAAFEADLVLPPRPSMVHTQLADAARSNGADLRVVCAAESLTVMKELVLCGVACAVMPCGAVRREVEEGRLAARRLVDPPLARTLYLTCAQDRLDSKAVQAICQEIRALVADLVASGAVGWAHCATAVSPVPASLEPRSDPAIPLG